MTAPYWTDGTCSLYLGDCREVLTEVPDASIDAIVTDPPYELGFMGRSWDSSGIAYDVDAWLACWRVLKPGGHLLAFGGTRTYHRMTCAIEDAGFEIRDSIHWMYGSGFPKGQDVGKLIDRRRDDRERILQVTRWLNATCKAAGWTSARIDALFGMNGMGSHWTAINGKAAIVPMPEQWDRLRDALDFDDTEIRPVVVELNARKGLVGESWVSAEILGEHSNPIPGMPGERFDVRDNFVRAANSDDARRWSGWNTQLKPAHEPIVVARKSTGFNTTVANVLQHGTGAINIDACRTATFSEGPGSTPPAADGGHRGSMAGALNRVDYDGSLGRWPTNVVFSHLEECGSDNSTPCVPGCAVLDLDRQTGIRKSGANPTRRSSDKFQDTYGDFAGQQECVAHRGADSGGASRFFPAFRYEAKAPASERPRLADGTAHTTVKPLGLMRWLVRLVTPPGGLVLDPFAGSGTTGEACLIEGFRSVLIEKDPQHSELIKARLDKPLQAALGFDELP